MNNAWSYHVPWWRRDILLKVITYLDESDIAIWVVCSSWNLDGFCGSWMEGESPEWRVNQTAIFVFTARPILTYSACNSDLSSHILLNKLMLNLILRENLCWTRESKKSSYCACASENLTDPTLCSTTAPACHANQVQYIQYTNLNNSLKERGSERLCLFFLVLVVFFIQQQLGPHWWRHAFNFFSFLFFAAFKHITT